MANLNVINLNDKNYAQHGDSFLLGRQFAAWQAAERAEDKVSGDAPKDQDSG